jgi:hypothetical protein
VDPYTQSSFTLLKLFGVAREPQVLASHNNHRGRCALALWTLLALQLLLYLALTGAAVLLIALFMLGPPTFDRRDRTRLRRAAHVDWLRTDDLGHTAEAHAIAAKHGRVGLCHCPGTFPRLSVHTSLGLASGGCLGQQVC